SRLTWSPEGVLLAEDEDADPGDAALDPTRDESDDSDRRHPAAGHPWHDAGAYYLQDPSAMGVVPVLDPVPGERILDLAAAPGGKSTYIADRLAGTGLLWSHDVEPSRAGSLVGNIERWGVSTIVVSHGPLARLEPLRGTFDRVLLDAPCSGEGMFRKSAAALALWTPQRVAEFVALQTRLLDQAAEFLKPGGVLVYSTCTFGVAENEGAVASLLERRPDLALDDLDVAGASGGLQPHGATAGIGRASARWWPHKHTGEGHFVARMRKDSATGSAERPRRVSSAEPGGEPTRGEHAAYEDFCRDVLGNDAPSTGRLRRFGEWLHLVPDIDVPTDLAPRRVGAPVGRVSKGRFTPHHALSRLLPAH